MFVKRMEYVKINSTDTDVKDYFYYNQEKCVIVVQEKHRKHLILKNINKENKSRIKLYLK